MAHRLLFCCTDDTPIVLFFYTCVVCLMYRVKNRLLFCCTDDTPLTIFQYLRRFGHRFVMYRVKNSSKIAHQRKPGAEERGSVGFTCNYCKRFSQPRVYQDVSQSFTMYRTLPMMAPLSFPSRGWCIIRVFTYTRRIYIIWARIECLSHCFSSIILIGH